MEVIKIKRTIIRDEQPIGLEGAAKWSEWEIKCLMQEIYLHAMKMLNSPVKTTVSFQDAMDWVLSEDEEPFSFEIVCAILGKNADQERAEILYRCKKRGRAIAA